MAIAYDNVSNPTPGTGNLSWTHAPSGTPRGVIVYVMQYNNGTDQVTGVTYGGVTMTEVTGSPLLKTSGEAMAVYAYFLGAGIPTGNQTVAVSVNATGSDKAAVCYTVTAADTVAIQEADATITSDSLENPSTTLALGGRSAFCSIGFVSGVANVSSVSPLSGWNSSYEYDAGAEQLCSYKYDTIGTTDVTAGWTAGADDALGIAIALREATLLISGKTDGVTLGESKTVTMPDALKVNKSEGLTVGEAAPGVSVTGGTQPDRDINIATEPTITLGESRSVVMSDLAISRSEGLTLGEVRGQSVSDPVISRSDGVTLGEVKQLATGSITTSVTDGVALADTLPGRYRDSVRLGETVAVELAALADLSVSKSEGITLGEAASAKDSDPQITRSEGVALGETVGAVIQDNLVISKTEGVTLGEVRTVAHANDLVISKSDTVAVADSANVSREEAGVFSIGKTDTVALGESITLAVSSPAINKTDTVAVADSANVSREEIGVISIGKTDTLAIGESKNLAVSSPELSKDDTIALGEARTVSVSSPTMSKSEGVTIADTPIVYLAPAAEITISVSDGISLADVAAVVMINALAVSVTDGATLADIITLAIEGQAIGIIDLSVDKRLFDTHIRGRGVTAVDSRTTGLHIRNSGHG